MRFTTAQLIDLDNDIRSAVEKSNAIEEEIVNGFIDSVREIADDLLTTADLLADLDVWTALALVAVEYDWVRPKLTCGVEFNVVGTRHPVIEYVLRLRGDNFVKNDCD